MKRLIYSLLLISVTAVWGWTFVVVQDAIEIYGVLGFLALRFALATGTLAPIARFRITRRELFAGGGIGAVLALGFLFQTVGLLYTTPTNSGLITGLFVVFAPLADRLLFGVHVQRQVLTAILLSFAGMVLLAGQSPSGARVGDVLTLGCAAAFGVHIALLSRYSRNYDAVRLALAQMISSTVLFFAVWPLFETVKLPSREVWFALLITGLIASAGAFYVQTFVQQKLPAARAGVILTMEPVFAALFGYWLAGDRLTSVQFVGAALILSALVLGEVLPLFKHRPAR